MRILLLTTFFPPANTIAAHRMYSFAEYLPDFGIDVTVVTVKRPGDLARIPQRASVIYLYEDTAPVNRFVKKRSTIRRALHYSGLRPLRGYYWGRFSRTLTRHIDEVGIDDFDGVLASYGPESVLRAAELLHDRHGLPLLLDFRDPWLGNRYYAWTPVESILIKTIQRRLLKKAQLITTVSKLLARSLRTIANTGNIAVVYNGYYEEQSCHGTGKLTNKSRSGETTVCYCGSLYAGIQPIDIFLEALGRVANVRLRLALLDEADVDFVRTLTQRFNVDNRVEVYQSLSHAASLQLQRESDVLLFLNRTDGSAKEVLTGKLFEYLSTGNFILGIGHPEDEARDLIRTYRNGVYVHNATQAAHVLSSLKNFTREPADMSFFTRRNQAKIMANMIKNAIG